MDRPHRQAAPSPEIFNLTAHQEEVVRLPFTGNYFLDGPAGSGKTTAALLRLENGIRSGLADKCLVLVPQRTLGRPYLDLTRQAGLPPFGRVDILTLGGLARRAVDMFWPVAARQAGFAHPGNPPVFLTLESAQYYLARFVDPKLQEGRFDAVTIDRSRLLSQILDNLNKSAVIGFPSSLISAKLKAAWTGSDGQRQVYDQVQACADQFRAFCIEHNLLDFSLQLQVFTDHLWHSDLFRSYLAEKYRHLFYDNIEEDFPVAHDVVREWLPELDSALLVGDSGAGFRSFLGADPVSAASLGAACSRKITFSRSFVESPKLAAFRQALTGAIRHEAAIIQPVPAAPVVSISQEKFVPQMVEAVGEQVSRLFKEGDAPPAICIVAPFLSDSLCFSLGSYLSRLGVPYRSHRPSHPLSDEPAVRCLLAFARLAHPAWKIGVASYDLRSALMQALEGLDLVRADLLARAVLPASGESTLKSFPSIPAVDQERITSTTGRAYEILREWISGYRANPADELDIFMSRIFGELLSQRGFGFHKNFQAATASAELIESIQKFRTGRIQISGDPGLPGGLDYIRMLESGVIAAQYLGSWQPASPAEVYIAPAYTFLMNNQPVDYQIWLDLGNRGWWERLYQPLTHPVVLSRAWSEGGLWTDSHEVEMNRALLTRLVNGLVQRCRKGVFLHALTLNEQGDEQRGALLQAVQYLVRKNPELIQVADV